MRNADIHMNPPAGDVDQRDEPDEAAKIRPRFGSPVGQILIVALAMLLVVAAAVFFLRPQLPDEGSAEAGFARDMAQHHAQAVEMAGLIRDRTTRADLQILALDITLTQQAQIGRMQGWLDIWGLPLSRRQPPMAWMGMSADEPMPGMATRAEVNELADLRGPAAESRFLRLMIAHHQGGVVMAEAVLARTDRPEARRLAEAIVSSQRSEIDAMRAMLAATPGAAQPDGEDAASTPHTGSGAH